MPFKKNCDSIKKLLSQDAEEVRNNIAACGSKMMRKQVINYTKGKIPERWKIMFRQQGNQQAEAIKDPKPSKFEIVKEKVEEAKEKIGEVVSSAGDLVDSGKEKISEAIDTTGKAAISGKDKVVTTIKDGAQISKNALKNGAEKAKGLINKIKRKIKG